MDDTTDTAIRRTIEMGAIFMIGDGLLGLAMPRRHVALWRSSWRAADALVASFAGRERRRRAYGLVQIAAGVGLALAVSGQASRDTRRRTAMT